MTTRITTAYVTITCLLLVGCHGGKSGEEEVATTPVVAVRTAPVTVADVPLVTIAPGKTFARREERITSPIAGKIVSSTGREGEVVSAGEVIATVRAKESQAAIDGANALLRIATSEAQRESAHRSRELAESTQTVIAIQPSRTGVISSRNVSGGEWVNESDELFTVIDLSSIEFVADVPIDRIEDVRVNQTSFIRLVGFSQRDFEATVSAIDPRSDPESQTFKVRMNFVRLSSAANPMLKTEMVGSASIQVGIHRGALLVPRAAVLRDDETNTFTVVTVTPDSLAASIVVTVGATTDSLMEVTGQGLHAGLSVIIEGQYALPDSTRVTVLVPASQ